MVIRMHQTPNTPNTPNTPTSHKKKNYKGIGAQNKKKSKQPVIDENKDTDAEDLEVVENTSTTDDQNRWLEGLIDEQIETLTPPASKPPKKQARQMYPFKCSECGAKYKTENGYIKHLTEKHGHDGLD